MRSNRLHAAFVLLALTTTPLGCELVAGVGKAKLGDPKGDGGVNYCTAPHDCPPPDTSCQELTCTNSVCGISNASAGTTCNDNNGTQCDGNGACVVCLSVKDCPASTTCAAAACTQGACVTTNANAGTTCNDGNGVVCDSMGKCVAIHCNDGVQDADETDTDCGGASCSPCAINSNCIVNSDCASMGCDVTTHTCDADQCHDGIRDGKETDVDCGGGTCPACADGKRCGQTSDCSQYFICTNGACAREPESDCLDGKDNNGDGLADCQDPTCVDTTVSCVPAGPGGSPIGIVASTCPSGFGPGVQEHAGFHEGVCNGCSCSTSAQCQFHVAYITNSYACSGTGQNLYLVGPAGGTSACQGLNGTTTNQAYAFGVTTISQTCTVGGSPTYSSSPYWDVSTNFCPATRTSMTCTSGQVCARIPPSPKMTMCVELPGNVACPPGYQSPTHYYTGFSGGGCGGCPGACTPGTDRCGYSTNAYGYGDTSCGASYGTQYGPLSENKCSSLSGNPALYSANAVFTAAPDTCTVSQPSANASTLNGVSTVCCQ